MDGNYPPGFYCPERNQQERHSQQHQQHVTPYPMDLPYHPTSQHQPEFAVDQPLRPFPAPHTGPGLSMLSSIYHDSTAVPPNAGTGTIHEVHNQLPPRGQKIKSTTQSATYAPLLTSPRSLPESTTQDETSNPPTAAPSKQVQSRKQRKADGPRIVSLSTPELPQSLAFKCLPEGVVEGVLAKGRIEKGSEFGPYTGSLMSEEQGLMKESTWEVCVSGQVFFYLDGRKTWMSHVRCAQSEEEQNMEAYQFYGEIYFRSTRIIEPGSELKVFYNAEYAKRVGIHTKLNELRFNKDAQKFECSLCKDLFTSAKLVLRHTRYEHSRVPREELFPIVIWKRRKLKQSEPQTCTSLKDSTITNVTKAGDAEFSCGTCEKSFSNVGKLREHESFHKFNEGHVCTICDKKETNFWTLAKHMKTHEPEGMKFKCKECNQIYNRKSALRQHLSEFHGHRCRICLAKLTPCEKHKKTQQASTKNGPHAGKTLVVSSAPEEPKDMLGKTTNYYERPFKCRYCSNRYSTRNSVKAHEREQHTGDLFFKCPHCEKVFGREYRLIDHLRTHEENRMYRCTLCPRTFASESALNNHQGEHNGLKPFKCEICGRGFRLKSVYHAHKRRMHRENPLRFFCSVCNKGFSNKGNFTIHERRHKGIRPFVCLECGKSFTAKHCLNTHIKAMHTEEKAFSCNICGKTFSLNQNYTYHMFKHKEQGDVSSTKA
ncbi:histone-lysine N-methyltransferase PRDM9-like [Lytechinus variegatus]|uniref:histone-lysine N-methyltransferase PRDM9-like n=1 Tax=Lytechinus variegatus TaxID=7654 RepID=UPI001BB25E06|nr:histone-lysine N-methyltransferase PRDM9-like [Lytechinus variegatus]XP_041470860.1 histone-lysine N-methyltransferase PRDM9-like [Lytechinus variegatus]XP_041470861.1 histone-lysine N-methyltransferase PRDM9-like [Lytechinus variegatus]XP_041470862.1 histone-lysine N-methyltransferase PRDM9-like [Lytechinus variegatus]